jgi:hypothetical protein
MKAKIAERIYQILNKSVKIYRKAISTTAAEPPEIIYFNNLYSLG